MDSELGNLFRSSVGFTYTLDFLRGGLNPNRGVRLTFGQEFAGLGGDVKFVKTTTRAVAERDAFNEEVTLRATLEGGALHSLSGTNSHVTDRFFPVVPAGTGVQLTWNWSPRPFGQYLE